MLCLFIVIAKLSGILKAEKYLKNVHSFKNVIEITKQQDYMLDIRQ